MINKNYAEDIRTCQRIKFDQALYILTMYQKKIRKPRKAVGTNGIVDADTQMQDILCSWKNKWKMDLTKPILNCVTSVYPRVLIDLSKQESEEMTNYYTLMNRFLTRLRTEHEDQSNFKLVMQVYDRQVEYQGKDRYLISSKATVKGFLMMARDITGCMINKIQQNSEEVSENVLDVNTDNLQWQVWRPLRYVREIATRALLGDKSQMMEIDNDIEPKSTKTQNLIAFSSNVIKMMQKIKQSQHGSTLITVQPKIDELTMLIHPLLIAISANFKKQNLQKTKDYDWSKIQVQSKPMMQNLKNSYNCSKVVLINLDGYQSEFNLQMARNFKKHLLYISFPKQDAKLDDIKNIYSRRFFKKLMFRYSQNLYESYDTTSMNEDYKLLSRMERLTFNPQDYHINTQKLYQYKNDKAANNQDFNQNLYVFPIRMSILYQKFPEIFENKQDIQNHQSYFIRLIINYFLLNQISQFTPTLILISYSGRIHIQDNHFVQLIQQLTKISNYKLMFFPNFTTAFCSEEGAQVEDRDEQSCEYDNYIIDSRISASLKHRDMSEQSEQTDYEHWIQMFNKIARFLKVSSGTYNLNRSYDEEPLVSKYKNQFILSYIDELMTVLGKQYQNIDKIRFRNKDLSILPKLFQENIKNIKKTFEQTVPKLYFDIYDIIEYLLLERNIKIVPKRQELLKQYKINLDVYRELVDRLNDQILSKSNYEVTTIDIERMGEEIQREKNKKMKEIFNSLKESHLFQISSQKFEEKANVFFKTAPECKEYSSIVEETQSIKGLFETTFYLNPGKTNVKLYESTKILYKIDQIFRKTNKIPILIMNNLTDGSSQNSFQNYYSQLDISNSSQTVDKKQFDQKKCLATPITFQNQDGIIDRERKLFILADWNYCETQNYLVLFWPSKYDFLKAFLLKLMNKPYQPEIVNQFYVCRRGSKQVSFKKITIFSQCQISGRFGCSTYDFQNKVFIFGGFYEKQKNYLDLQHDIVTFDLQQYENGGQNKLVLENIKQKLYNKNAFQNNLQRKVKPNSFVRPRMEFQFFDKSQLYSEQNQLIEDNTKTVIMFGGYGQNFLRPYSLLTYYYYVLKFNRDTREIDSIQKKLIYNKAVPINTRQMTKNLGIIKTNRKMKNSVLQVKKLTEPDSYALYRNTFKIDCKDGEEDFKYKYKYMFCEEEYKNFKHQIKKLQELRAEEFDSSSVTVERDPNNNHIIALEKDGKKRWVTLRMQIPTDKAKKIEGNPKQVNLTHESIIYLDIWNSIISAIVKHQKYTQGKSVLVEYNTKCLQGLNFEQDMIFNIAMSWIKEFDFDLTLHILIICNKNTMAILHGEKLTATDKVKEFIVKRKKNKNQIGAFQIKQREQLVRKNEEVGLINTVFFRNRNKIMSIDFIALGDSYQFFISCQQIELNSANDQYRWNVSNLDKFDSTIKYQFCFSQKNFVRMDQLRFVQFLKSSNQNYLIVEHNRKKYICEVSRHTKILELVQQGALKFQKQNMQRGIILPKTQDRYNDRDFY